MTQATAPVFDQSDIQQNKTIAGLAFLGFLFFLPLIACPNSAFGKWAANQGLLILLANLAIGFINIIPIIGQLVWFVLGIALFISMIIGLVGAFNGQAKPIPIIGGITIIK